MQELGRIYWTRTGLRLAYSAAMLWLAFSVMAALMPKAAPAAGPAPTTPAEVLRGLVDGVVAVAALPGCNRSKRAGIPSPAQQRRLERRRQGYLPEASTVSVGERQPLP